jgi:hypothetical protein
MLTRHEQCYRQREIPLTDAILSPRSPRMPLFLPALNPTPLSNTLTRFLEKFPTTYKPQHHLKSLKIGRLRGFHGGNTGSNPVGDANKNFPVTKSSNWLKSVLLLEFKIPFPGLYFRPSGKRIF